MILPNGGRAQVSFLARKAQGLGYEGRARYFALERQTSLSASGWQPVSNYNRVAGNDDWVVYTPPISNPPAFYRARVWLEGP